MIGRCQDVYVCVCFRKTSNVKTYMCQPVEEYKIRTWRLFLPSSQIAISNALKILAMGEDGSESCSQDESRASMTPKPKRHMNSISIHDHQQSGALITFVNINDCTKRPSKRTHLSHMGIVAVQG